MVTQELQPSLGDLLTEVDAENLKRLELGKRLKRRISHRMFHMISFEVSEFLRIL